jgi:hypothetical protein
VSDTAARQLNHVELVYRPGERALAARLFELLGFRVIDSGGTFLSAFIDAQTRDLLNNALYASEVTPEQWELDRALLAQTREDGEVGMAARGYLDRVAHEPQRSFHFGIRYPTLEQLEATLAAVDAAGRDDAELAGRVAVSGVFRPGDPGSYTDIMVQAFVKTDVVAAGLLAFGQHLELQFHLPLKRPQEAQQEGTPARQ